MANGRGNVKKIHPQLIGAASLLRTRVPLHHEYYITNNVGKDRVEGTEQPPPHVIANIISITDRTTHSTNGKFLLYLIFQVKSEQSI